MLKRSKSLFTALPKTPKSQLELDLGRSRQPDRNLHKGGRSFYFFDFDDNIAVLSTSIFIFELETKKELALSSREFAEQSRYIGLSGPYKNYVVDFDDVNGSFRNFRDRDLSIVQKVMGKKQFFVGDLMQALGCGDDWKGPSWNCFYHAVYNRRPISVITARGHHPETIKSGIKKMVDRGHLPHEPNYLSLFPVSHPEIRKGLKTKVESLDIAKLKQAAIRSSVEEAVVQYGSNPHHRFGMSDDDPKNIELIVEEMARLKDDYQGMSFFVIATHQGNYLKREVFSDHTEDSIIPIDQQLQLF